MIKAYAVARILSEDNKKTIDAACQRYGYEIDYFRIADEAAGNVSDGEVLYCTNPLTLQHMDHLKWCHTSSAGVDNFIRTGRFDSRDVMLTNSSGAYGRAISEHIIMTVLMLFRRMPEYREITDAREWKHDLAIRSIEGSNISIIGTGDIGRTTAAKLKALGAATVTGFSRTGAEKEGFDKVFRMEDFVENIKDADAVIMCVPGTPETEGLLSRERIAVLPEKAVVINVGRGSSIDQDALVKALNEGRIAGAALDVVVPEPLPEDHPLWTARNCIITPHSSGDMGLQHSTDVTVEIFCENLKRYAEGLPLVNLIDPARGY